MEKEVFQVIEREISKNVYTGRLTFLLRDKNVNLKVRIGYFLLAENICLEQNDSTEVNAKYLTLVSEIDF
jgi:hypothetical protein